MICTFFELDDKVNIERLLRRVASAPLDPKAFFSTEGYTFGELYGLAATLKSILTKPRPTGTPICICIQNRTHVAAAMVAALSGPPALLLPHAHTLPTLQDARLNLPYDLALTAGEHALPDGVKLIDLFNVSELATQSDSNPASDLDSICVYLFTGGSTGAPKIWSKTVRNILSEAAYLAERFKICSEDRILATVPPNHIYGLLYAVMLPLVCGASVSVRTPVYPTEIVQALDETQATILVSIPAHYRSLGGIAIHDHQLTRAFSSAGALDPGDGRAFHNATGVTITEIYGSTETGGIAYRQRETGQSAFRPFECLDINIEDTHLWVRSDFLSVELGLNSDGFYKTADRVALMEDAGFILLGRSDGIIKVGGKRVDLAQIQQVIIADPEVNDAYVFARPVKNGRENEILALVEGRATPARIMAIAKKKLPSYALPRSIKMVAQIPRSAVGKYSRTAIEKLFLEGL